MSAKVIPITYIPDMIKVRRMLREYRQNYPAIQNLWMKYKREFEQKDKE